MTNIIVVLPKLEEAKGVKNILVRSESFPGSRVSVPQALRLSVRRTV